MALMQWLIDRRQALGLSQARFAPILRVSQPTWNELESRHRAGERVRLSWQIISSAIREWPEDRDAIVDEALADGSPEQLEGAA